MRVASISGGRSSAMMLKILLENGFGQQPGDIVCFCNTGREHEATLDFVHECSIRWQVPIIWLEYRKAPPKFEVVTYETAARRTNGSRPFTELLEERNYLPNPVKRICTAEMKIKTIRRYVRRIYKHKGIIPTYVGLRYDEPDRVARKKAQNAAGKEAEFVMMPLNELRITKTQRNTFWSQQGFDLNISSYSDNCDFCYLKSKWQQIRRIREEPDLVDWWIEQEEKAAKTAKRNKNGQFRKEYSFKTLKQIAQSQLYFNLPIEQEISISCSCTD